MLTASLPCRQHKQNLGSGLKALAETLQHSDDEWVRIMAAAAGQYSGPLAVAAVENLSAPVSHGAVQSCMPLWSTAAENMQWTPHLVAVEDLSLLASLLLYREVMPAQSSKEAQHRMTPSRPKSCCTALKFLVRMGTGAHGCVSLQ